jgi:hypothetical protein
MFEELELEELGGGGRRVLSEDLRSRPVMRTRARVLKHKGTDAARGRCGARTIPGTRQTSGLALSLFYV